MTLNILFVLIPVSLVLAVVALVLFVWAAHTGQFDDLETPAVRILGDERGARSGREPHATLDSDEAASAPGPATVAPTDRNADER